MGALFDAMLNRLIDVELEKLAAPRRDVDPDPQPSGPAPRSEGPHVPRMNHPRTRAAPRPGMSRSRPADMATPARGEEGPTRTSSSDSRIPAYGSDGSSLGAPGNIHTGPRRSPVGVEEFSGGRGRATTIDGVDPEGDRINRRAVQNASTAVIRKGAPRSELDGIYGKGGAELFTQFGGKNVPGHVPYDIDTKVREAVAQRQQQKNKQLSDNYNTSRIAKGPLVDESSRMSNRGGLSEVNEHGQPAWRTHPENTPKKPPQLTELTSVLQRDAARDRARSAAAFTGLRQLQRGGSASPSPSKDLPAGTGAQSRAQQAVQGVGNWAKGAFGHIASSGPGRDIGTAARVMSRGVASGFATQATGSAGSKTTSTDSAHPTPSSENKAQISQTTATVAGSKAPAATEAKPARPGFVVQPGWGSLRIAKAMKEDISTPQKRQEALARVDEMRKAQGAKTWLPGMRIGGDGADAGKLHAYTKDDRADGRKVFARASAGANKSPLATKLTIAPTAPAPVAAPAPAPVAAPVRPQASGFAQANPPNGPNNQRGVITPRMTMPSGGAPSEVGSASRDYLRMSSTAAKVVPPQPRVQQAQPNPQVTPRVAPAPAPAPGHTQVQPVQNTTLAQRRPSPLMPKTSALKTLREFLFT